MTGNAHIKMTGNPWRFDEGTENIFITFEAAGIKGGGDADVYYIPAATLTSPSEVLDWLAQLSEKTWATNEILGGLVRALDVLGVLR